MTGPTGASGTSDNPGSGAAWWASFREWEAALWSFDSDLRHAAHLVAPDRFASVDGNLNALRAADTAARKLVEFPDSLFERVEEFSSDVACALASNRRAPERLLRRLYRLYLDRREAGSDWQWLGLGEINLARNPNTPVPILRELYDYGLAAGGFDHHAVTSLAYNPSTPADIIEAISGADIHPVTRGAIARRFEPEWSNGTDPPHFGCYAPGCPACAINHALQEAAAADPSLGVLDLPVRFFPHQSVLTWSGGPTISKIVEVIRSARPDTTVTWDDYGTAHLGVAGRYELRLTRNVDTSSQWFAYARSVLTGFASGLAGRRVFDPNWPYSSPRLGADSDVVSATVAERLFVDLVEENLGCLPQWGSPQERAHVLLHEDLPGLVEAARGASPGDQNWRVPAGPPWPCPACESQPTYAVYDLGAVSPSNGDPPSVGQPPPPGAVRVAGFCSEHAYERPAPATLPDRWHLVLLDGWRWQAEHFEAVVAGQAHVLLAVSGPRGCDRCPKQARFVWIFEGRYHDPETAELCKWCSAPDGLLHPSRLTFRWVEADRRWYHATGNVALGDRWQPRVE